MITTTCSNCGAELIPGTGFCRHCGSRTIDNDEGPTTVLPAADATTRRLEAQEVDPEINRPSSRRMPSRAGVFFAVLAMGLVAWVAVIGARAIFKHRTASSGPVSRALIYPGSRIVLDLTQDGGGSVLQLETHDAMTKVQAWYVAQLKPDKIMQPTMNSAILKKDNVLATIITESSSTTIVIKQSAP